MTVRVYPPLPLWRQNCHNFHTGSTICPLPPPLGSSLCRLQCHISGRSPVAPPPVRLHKLCCTFCILFSVPWKRDMNLENRTSKTQKQKKMDPITICQNLHTYIVCVKSSILYHIIYHQGVHSKVVLQIVV